MDVIQPFHVMKLLATAKSMEAAGRSIIHMEVGEPDFDTPEPIVNLGIEALRHQHMHYTAAVGNPQLRAAISQYYQQHLGVTIDPQRIIITPGASGALQLVLSVLINPGDDVLMADPGYPCNRNFVHLLAGNPVSVPVDESSQFQIQVDHLSAHWTNLTRALLLASPSNPTGTIIPPESMQSIIDYASQHQAAVIVDEIYQGLSYETAPYTALQFSEDIFVINSFSKFFGMTGWRLGWIVAPPAYIEDLDKLAQNLYLAASTPAQQAALAAFTPETFAILEQRRQIYQQRRDFLLPALRQLGFKIPCEPEGAFYIYADCSELTDDSYAFCLDVLDQVGVAITPGIDFGHFRPERYVRFSYTTEMSQLKLGVERLQVYLNERKLS
jgi:aspartate/methionine/tyrosine aminotransferase